MTAEMQAESVPVEDAIINIERFLDTLTSGKEVILTRNNIAVARLLPLVQSEGRVPQLGTAAGQVWIADDFDDIPEGFEEYL